jgi:hypothetical protein
VAITSIQTEEGLVTGLGGATLVSGDGEDGTWRFEWVSTSDDALTINIVITNGEDSYALSWPLGF